MNKFQLNKWRNKRVKEKMVDVEIALSHELMFSLFMLAHENDMTFNELVSFILQKYIKEDKNV
jgi:hypothetical protein